MIPDISFTVLILASLLVLANGILSVLFSLDLGKQITIATFRMIVQLFLVGLVLTELFQRVSLGWTLLVASIMIGFAGYEVGSRQKNKFKGIWTILVGLISMTLPVLVVTGLALIIFLQAEPWYQPRYSLPLLGMILGNTMTGVSLGLNALITSAQREYASIEAQLALGEPIRSAMRFVMRDALRTGMMPIIISMAATGVVSLPGMMTGQILSGVPPAIAVKYQLLIMFHIAGATSFGVLLAVQGAVYRMTDSRHRLRLDRLK